MVVDFVGKALQVEHGSEVVALARVVKHHVENDGYIGSVKGLHQVAEIMEVIPVLRGSAVTVFRSEKIDGAVSPIVM